MAFPENNRQLPTEIWEHILLNIKDPYDILNCVNVNSIWKSFFDKQLHIIYFRLTLPNLLPYLTDRDLLSCCQICHAWNDVVDDLINEIVEDVIPPKSRALPDFDILFGDIVTIGRFLRRVSPSEGHHPVILLPYRDITIICQYNEELDAIQHPATFLNQVHTYFIKHGSLVRRLTLILSHDALNYIEMVDLLHRVLNNTPNLHKLIINFSGPMEIELAEGEEENLNLFLAQSRLPHLGQFKSLGIKYCPQPIVMALFAHYKDQLCDFLLQDISGLSLALSTDNTDENLLQPQNLFVHVTNDENALYLEHFLDFHSCQVTLMIVEIYGDFDTFVEILAGVINRQGSLERLSLGVKEEGNHVIDALQGLRLPTVKVLTLQTLQFPGEELLREVVPSLEVLLLKYSGSAEVDQLGNIEMYKELYKNHRFWKFLPSLDIVQVVITSTPRDGEIVESQDGQDGENFESRYLYSREVYKGLKIGGIFNIANYYKPIKCIVS